MREPSLIMDAEAELDRALVDWREVDRWSEAWIGPAERWSAAVWKQAVEEGPLPIPADDLPAGARIANAPVYICGAPRSGTTLVRDLLDSHPGLAVLPSEGKLFEAFGVDDRRERDALSIHGKKWLRLLANPNHQQPFWVLGRGSTTTDAYVRFARAFMSWNSALACHDFVFRLQPMAALSLAGAAGQDIAAVCRFVDKTPGYEFHLERIRSRYRHARVIYVVRDPRDVAASYLAGIERTRLDYTPVARILRNVVSSYLAARRARRLAPADCFLIIRYEDLVEDRKKQTARIASFLGIDWNECLMRQTIMGLAAEPNSSFHGSVRRKFKPRNMKERFWLAAALRCHALVTR